MDLTEKILGIMDLLEEDISKLKELDAHDKKNTVVIEKAIEVLKKSRAMLDDICLRVKDDEELNKVLDYIVKRSNELVDRVSKECGKESVADKQKAKPQNKEKTEVKKNKVSANPLKEWLMEDKE